MNPELVKICQVFKMTYFGQSQTVISRNIYDKLADLLKPIRIRQDSSFTLKLPTPKTINMIVTKISKDIHQTSEKAYVSTTQIFNELIDGVLLRHQLETKQRNVSGIPGDQTHFYEV